MSNAYPVCCAEMTLLTIFSTEDGPLILSLMPSWLSEEALEIFGTATQTCIDRIKYSVPLIKGHHTAFRNKIRKADTMLREVVQKAAKSLQTWMITSQQKEDGTNTSFQANQSAFEAHVTALLSKLSTREQSKRLKQGFEVHLALLDRYSRKREEGLERLLSKLTECRDQVDQSGKQPDPEDPGASACYRALFNRVCGDYEKVKSLVDASRFDNPTHNPSKKDVREFRAKQQTVFSCIKGIDSIADEMFTTCQSEGSRYNKVSNLEEYILTKTKYNAGQVSCTLVSLYYPPLMKLAHQAYQVHIHARQGSGSATGA